MNFSASLQNLFHRAPKAKPIVPSNAIPYRPLGQGEQDFNIIGHAADSSVFGTIRAHGVFEPHVIAIARKLVKRRDVVLDVGANIGALTCVFSALADKGKVYAFEASVSVSQYLRANVDLNSLDNVQILTNAVSSVSGEELEIHVEDEFMAGAYVSSIPSSEGRVERVTTVSLDTWAKLKKIRRIDVIKMDIEGSEIFALDGAKEILRKHRPTLFVECNAITMFRFQRKKAADLFDVLSEFYDHIYLIADLDGQILPIRIRKLGDLVLSLKFGRGNEDLVCTKKPLNEFSDDFDGYLARLRSQNENREIVLDPNWKFEASELSFTKQPGEIFTVRAKITNLSSSIWRNSKKNPVNLSYHIKTVSGRVHTFDGVRTALACEIAPGATVELEINVIAPSEPGFYRIEFSPVQEGILWFEKTAGILRYSLSLTVK